MSDADMEDGGARESRRVTKLIEGVTALAQPIAASFGCEVDRVEFRPGPQRGILRVYIDKPGGVVIEDCSRVSRQLSAELDVNDFIAKGAPTRDVGQRQSTNATAWTAAKARVVQR